MSWHIVEAPKYPSKKLLDSKADIYLRYQKRNLKKFGIRIKLHANS